MKIVNESGWYWNEENICWTQAKEAATEYADFAELPAELPLDDTTWIDLDPDANCIPSYFAKGDPDARAWTAPLQYCVNCEYRIAHEFCPHCGADNREPMPEKKP